MTQNITVNRYTFNPATRTIRFDDYSFIRIEGVRLITNMRTNEIIYQFSANAKGGTVAGNILTLTYDTTAMVATDPLAIIYDEPVGGVVDFLVLSISLIKSYLGELSGIVQELQAGRKVMATISSVDSSLGTVATVSSVTSVAAVTQVNNFLAFNTIPAENLIRELDWISYNTGIRSNIV